MWAQAVQLNHLSAGNGGQINSAQDLLSQAGREAATLQKSKFSQTSNHPPVVEPEGCLWEDKESQKSRYLRAECLALLPRFREQKKDLSHINMHKWETSKDHQSLHYSRPTFRANEGLRKLLFLYVQELEPLNQCRDQETVSAEIDNALATVFTPSNIAILHRSGYDETDLVSWSWILFAKTAGLAIRRYEVFHKHLTRDKKFRIPLFVPLQILRAEKINGASLQILVRVLQDSMRDADKAETGIATPSWDSTSTSLLIVRLIRHTRNTAPELLETVTKLAMSLLLLNPASSTIAQQRLSHICNRLLSLLALPIRLRPFRSSVLQQRAQINLVKRMLDNNPAIQLNREGFRALVKVQLLHKKTQAERDWAAAKGPSWPPWRRDRLGIEETIDYPGKQSRASKILSRMQEAGYDHTSWEQSAAVLAGWDTDKSPTIQSRSVLKHRVMPWLAKLIPSQDVTNPPCHPDVWAARITATRSVREAWSCFLAFQEEIADSLNASINYPVYYAMFQKLFARVHADNLRNESLPGESRETFPDPVAQRDLMFVESEPPTIPQFYELMLAANVKPAGRLLSGLLNCAADLGEGLRYIRQSSYAETRKDVLLHAEKYNEEFIRETISNLPDHFFAAFIGFLSRSNSSFGEILLPPKSLSTGPRAMSNSAKKFTPLAYGCQMLYISQTSYLPAWNAHLRGLCNQVKIGPVHADHFWRSMLRTLKQMRQADVQPDFTTFRTFCQFCETCQVSGRVSLPDTEVLEHVQLLFTTIVYRNNEFRWITETPNAVMERPPDPEDILALVRILGVVQAFTSLHEVVEWLNTHSQALKKVHDDRRNIETWYRNILTLVRVFTEQRWEHERNSGSGPGINGEDWAEIEAQSAAFGWPSDKEVETLLEKHQVWFRKLRYSINRRSAREAWPKRNARNEEE